MICNVPNEGTYCIQCVIRVFFVYFLTSPIELNKQICFEESASHLFIGSSYYKLFKIISNIKGFREYFKTHHTEKMQ